MIFNGTGEDGPAIFSMLINFEADSGMEVFLLTSPTSTQYYTKCSTTYAVNGNKLTVNASDCDGSGQKIEQVENDFVVNNNELTIKDETDGDITFQKWTGDTGTLTQLKSQPIFGR